MGKKYDELEVARLIHVNRREAAIEAEQIGFDLGKRAQKEEYALLERPVSIEAEHKLNCPECRAKIYIPCINYEPYMTPQPPSKEDK